MSLFLRSWKAVLLFSLILPPVGFVLLWMKPQTRVFLKIAMSFAIVLVSIVHLKYFFGMRVELDGSAMPTIVAFRDPESHYARIEKSRAEIAAKTPPPVPTKIEAPRVEAAKESTSTEWVDYRGTGRTGVYTGSAILTQWPVSGLQRLWKQPIGGGYASFAVANRTAFTIEQRRTQEVVAAYDVDTGREIWTNGWDAEFKETMGGDGPRATPVWNDGRVYALGASGELRSLDARTGKQFWSRNILDGAANLQWGMAAAPLIVDDKIVVSTPNRLAAYNRLTGEPVWKTAERRMAYVSPILVTLAGRKQIVHVSAFHALGIAPEDGSLLWERGWGQQSEIKSAQPILLGEDRVYVSGGYGQGALVIEVLRKGEGFDTRTVWENTRMKNRFNSAVLHEGHIYGFDESIFACIDAKTGELKWKGGRYGYGQVVLANGHLIVLTESGDLALIKATPAGHQELASFSAIDGKTWNNPAIANGLLLVRNANEMACFRIGK